MPGGRSGGGKGLSPQPAASVCPDVLWAGEGYRAIGGYSGTQQHQHYADIYDGVREDAPEATGEDAIGNIKNHGIVIPW